MQLKDPNQDLLQIKEDSIMSLEPQAVGVKKAGLERISRDKRTQLKSREENKDKNLSSWSLSRAKAPEPSIDNYIVNIDGSIK